MPQINFLPWAKLDDQIRLGPTTVVPWSVTRDYLAGDVRDFIDKCFARYTTNDGHPMPDIAIAYLGDDVTADLSNDQRQIVRKSIDVLTFVAVTQQLGMAMRSDHGGFGVSNSERFQLVTQQLGGLDDYVTVSSGGTHQMWGINDVHFCIPWCVGSDFYRLDKDSVLPLSNLVHEESPLGGRLSRALEWFRLAHTGNDDTSELSRIVMMATAYEILFDPADEKRKGICTAIHELTSGIGVRTETVTIGKQTFHLAAPAAWFDAFYRLRNKIVHGDAVENGDLRFDSAARPLSQRTVSALVLWEVIMWYLFDRGEVAKRSYRLARSLSQFAGNAEPKPEFVRYIASDTLGIADIHKALGWYEKSDS